MRGGVILFRGAGAAARRYLEADRSRADEYYLEAGAARAELSVVDGTGCVVSQGVLTPVAVRGLGRLDRPDQPGADGQGTSARRGTPGVTAVRGDSREHPEVVVDRRRSAPGCVRRSGCRAAGCRGRDPVLARPALGHPRRPARQAGGRARRAAADGGHLAQDLTRRRPAPAHPPADRDPGLGRRRVARAGHRGAVPPAGRDPRARHGGAGGAPAAGRGAGRARPDAGPGHRRGCRAAAVQRGDEQARRPGHPQPGGVRGAVGGRAPRPGAGPGGQRDGCRPRPGTTSGRTRSRRGWAARPAGGASWTRPATPPTCPACPRRRPWRSTS